MGSKTATSKGTSAGTATTTLSPQVQAAYNALLEQIGGATTNPAITGATAGLGNIANDATADNNFGSAANAYASSLTPASQTVNQYLSPYLQDVLQTQIASQNEQNAEQQQGVVGNAAAQGALGGNRVAIAQGELQRQNDIANNAANAQTLQAGYQQALTAAQQQQGLEQNAASGYNALGTSGLNSLEALLAAGQVPAGVLSTLSGAASGLSNTGQTVSTTGTTSETKPTGNSLSSIFGGIATLLSSDRRAKEDITPVGKSFDGQTIYRFRYRGEPTTRMGLIAQEVEKDHPEAVANTAFGKAVDYRAATERAAKRGHFATGGVIPYSSDLMALAQGAVQQATPQNDNAGQDDSMGQIRQSIADGQTIGKAAKSFFGGLEQPHATGAPMSIDPSSFDALPAVGLGAQYYRGGVIPLRRVANARRGYDDGGSVDSGSNWLDGLGSILSQAFYGPKDGGSINQIARGVVPDSDAAAPMTPPPVVTPPHTPTPAMAASAPVAAPSPAVIPPMPRPAPGRPILSSAGLSPVSTGAPMSLAAPGNDDQGVVPPGKNIGATFATLEQAYNLPPGYLGRTMQIESHGNPNADNGVGKGPFQITAPTAAQYGLGNPNDPLASADTTAKLASDNARFLAAGLGRQPTPGEIYLAHQQGATGALNLITHPNAPAVDVIGKQAVIQNGGTPDMTAGQFANMWTSRFAGNAPATPAVAMNDNVTPGVVPEKPQAGLGGLLNQLFVGNGSTAGSPNGAPAAGWNPLHLSDDARSALLSMGLGIMSGTSPNAFANIGEGGLKGIADWRERQAMERENFLASLQDITTQQAGQQLYLNAMNTAAGVGKTNVEAAAARFIRTPTPAGLMVYDVENPQTPPRIIPWSQMTSGNASLSGDNGATYTPTSATGDDAGSSDNAPPLPQGNGAGAPQTPGATQNNLKTDKDGFVLQAPSPTGINPLLMNPNPHAADVLFDQTKTGLGKARDDYLAAQNMGVQLDLMKEDVSNLPDNGVLSQGAGLTTRAKLAKELNTWAQIANIQLPFDPDQVSSIEDLNKKSIGLGFQLARTLGSREAESIVSQAQTAVPGAENTPQGFRRIVGGIEAINKRQSDYYQFLQSYAAQNYGDITGADALFNQLNPPDKYVKYALLQSAITPKKQSDIDNAPKGTLFNVNGQLLVK